jgi:hypothetical protein
MNHAMCNVRMNLYRAVSIVTLLVAGGCGQAAPPPGAPKDFSSPSIELGPEGDSKEAAGGDTKPASESPTPPAQPGETK